MVAVDSVLPSVINTDVAKDPSLSIQSTVELSGSICSPSKSNMRPVVVTGRTKEVRAKVVVMKSLLTTVQEGENE